VREEGNVRTGNGQGNEARIGFGLRLRLKTEERKTTDDTDVVTLTERRVLNYA